MNISLLTNIISVLIIVLGYLSPLYKDQILSIGFFALSGAVTNWLAIYMLFEKVPFLYGSGVIPNRFEDFKIGIKSIIMDQFFTDENLDKFFQGEQDSIVAKMHFEPIVDAINYDKVYDGLVEVVMKSPFGSMLGMFGGQGALEPMRQLFEVKMRTTVLDLTKSPAFLKALEENMLPSHITNEVKEKIERLIDQRLEELTPQMVKEIMQGIIRKHLGWLVVWGGVFGGLIGLVMSFIK